MSDLEWTPSKKEPVLYAQKFGNTFCDDIEGKGVIASEAWQSRREKLYYYRNEDILFMRLPRFARNDNFIFRLFY